jgi:hypothetical protein
VGDRAVHVSGDDGVDGAPRQRPRQLEDVAAGLARRQIVGAGEPGAGAAGARGRARSPAKFRGCVMDAVAAFASPMTPIFARASPTVTIVVAAKFGQAGGLPVAASTRLAARNGKCASAARALSAPRGSSPGARGVCAGPAGP